MKISLHTNSHKPKHKVLEGLVPSVLPLLTKHIRLGCWFYGPFLRLINIKFKKKEKKKRNGKSNKSYVNT